MEFSRIWLTLPWVSNMRLRLLNSTIKYEATYDWPSLISQSAPMRNNILLRGRGFGMKGVCHPSFYLSVIAALTMSLLLCPALGVQRSNTDLFSLKKLMAYWEGHRTGNYTAVEEVPWGGKYKGLWDNGRRLRGGLVKDTAKLRLGWGERGVKSAPGRGQGIVRR